MASPEGQALAAMNLDQPAHADRALGAGWGSRHNSDRRGPSHLATLGKTVLLGVLVGPLVGGRVLGATPVPPHSPADAPTTIVAAAGGSVAEKLAAKELRRYIYLRTGELLPMVVSSGAQPEPKPAAGPLIVVGQKDRPEITSLPCDAACKARIAALRPQEYLLKTLRLAERPVLLVAGGDPIGTLYGAYAVAEKLGVRFYLHGDVVSEHQQVFALPELDETRKPLFELRGIQPFHDFPEGPDWWNRDGYKAILGQLPKMGMNFFGLHTYPQGEVGPEPLVWIGPPDAITAAGKVTASYPSRHFSVSNPTGAWGYRPGSTGEYRFGAADLFDRDDYGPDYQRDTSPWNKMEADACNGLFDRMGEMLGDTFAYARMLGIKTCLGTETPLVIPTAVRQRLQAAGKNPADPAVVQEIYEGMLRRIARVHPLDYYWVWTPEGWTWGAVSQQQIDATMADLRSLLAAANKVKPPFTLATCGWVLGPPQTPALFDDFLPKDMPMSCINRTVGNTPVEPGFAKVAGRPKWAIPWMEDDPGLTQPQLWAGRMRRDAADALSYGCSGLMGIHWRTRILAPNVSALAKAAWDQSGWNTSAPVAADGAKPTTPEGVDGGQVASFANNKIDGTEDTPLYQNVRYDLNAYHINVPNGTYDVTLKLCEPAYAEKGRRVFGAKVQGKLLFEHLDIFARVGRNRALDLTAKAVAVTDGSVSIEFVREVEFPCIAAIAIEGKTADSNQFAGAPYQRKINCGGGTYKDYEADLQVTGASSRPRYLPVADFYADWARAEFGSEVARPVAAIFTRLDGQLPRTTDWVSGPGCIRPDASPWAEARKAYGFVDELEAQRSKVNGAGNLERFDYWLNNFRYMRSIAELRCVWARYSAAIDKVKAEKDASAQQRLARELALPLRKELVAVFGAMQTHLLDTVSNAGEMGNVCNWQQQTLPVVLTGPGLELAKLLGEALPADAVPSNEFTGAPRVFVPELRTAISAGESLKLTVIVLGPRPQTAELCWRPLGRGDYAKVPLTHVARGVYSVALPAAALTADFEYYVEASAGQQKLRFPATGAALPQTVVVCEK